MQIVKFLCIITDAALLGGCGGAGTVPCKESVTERGAYAEREPCVLYNATKCKELPSAECDPDDPAGGYDPRKPR